MTLRTNNLVDSPEIEAKALDSIKKAKMPVSIEYVSKETGLAWHQARGLLFRLAAERKIAMLNTTKSWVFFMEGSA